MQTLLSHSISLPKISNWTHSWTFLSRLPQPFLSVKDNGYRIEEKINNETVFSMRRDIVSNRRYTDIDLYGLFGLSRINPHDTHCYITEGVSDGISAMLLLPSKNVLAITNLGGSQTARKIIISLFDSVTIIHDNDQAGRQGLQRWTSFLRSFNIKVDSWTPDGCKDLTEALIKSYRIDNEDILL